MKLKKFEHYGESAAVKGLITAGVVDAQTVRLLTKILIARTASGPVSTPRVIGNGDVERVVVGAGTSHEGTKSMILGRRAISDENWQQIKKYLKNLQAKGVLIIDRGPSGKGFADFNISEGWLKPFYDFHIETDMRTNAMHNNKLLRMVRLTKRAFKRTFYKPKKAG